MEGASPKWTISRNRGVARSLQPAASLEDQVGDEGDERHQEQGEGVVEEPVQLWHVAEVHPVDRANERWREQDGGPGGDLLYFLVLSKAGQGQVHAEDALQPNSPETDENPSCVGL